MEDPYFCHNHTVSATFCGPASSLQLPNPLTSIQYLLRCMQWKLLLVYVVAAVKCKESVTPLPALAYCFPLLLISLSAFELTSSFFSLLWLFTRREIFRLSERAVGVTLEENPLQPAQCGDCLLPVPWKQGAFSSPSCNPLNTGMWPKINTCE